MTLDRICSWFPVLQEDDDEVRPVLYSCGRGAKSTISLPGTHPSKNIPIDSVGIVGAVQVTSDLKKTRQKVRRQAGPRASSDRPKAVV